MHLDLVTKKSLALPKAMLGSCWRWNVDENGLGVNGERGNGGNRVGRAEQSWRGGGGGGLVGAGLVIWD